MTMLPLASARSLIGSALACLLLCAAPSGCKKKNAPKPEVAARFTALKPQGAERLAQIAKLAPKSKSTPATYTDAPLPKDMKPAAFTVLGADELDASKGAADTGALGVSDGTVSLCKGLVEPAREMREDSDLTFLEKCARAEYAAVVRQSSFTPPQVTSSSTYAPGTFRGDVLVFELATGELRGRYALDVTQDDKLKLTGKEKPRDREWEQQATAYLRSKVQAEVQKKLLVRAP